MRATSTTCRSPAKRRTIAGIDGQPLRPVGCRGGVCHGRAGTRPARLARDYCIPLVAAGKVRSGDIALSRDPWPTREKQISNAFDNQFQLPVLFYLACGFSILMQVGFADVILAWAFVASRYAHALIFVTTNDVPKRFFAFSIGFFVLLAFWLLLLFRLAAVGIAFGLH